MVKHSPMIIDKIVQQRSRQMPTRVISFTSGKGGVGKSTTVLNVALALARAGRKVMLFDADLSLANIDVMLGIQPKATLADVLAGRCQISEILVDGPEGISIIPAASGIEELCALSAEQRFNLIHELEQVSNGHDYLLIDTQAGIGPDVMHFNAASHEVVCVVTPEPTSLTDSYALIKILATRYREREVSILVNQVNAPSKEVEARAQKVFNRLARSVDRFLHLRLNYLGYVPSDDAVVESIQSQKALLEVFPSCKAAMALSGIARRIDNDFHALRVKGGMQFFFQQLLEVTAHGG